MPNGLRYAYKDAHSATIDKPLELAQGDLECQDNTCALGSTLQQLYTGKKTLGFVLYNDEAPALAAVDTPNADSESFSLSAATLDHAGDALAYERRSRWPYERCVSIVAH